MMRDLLGETPADILSQHADPDAVDSFIKWRKAVKKPLTDRAAKMIAKTLTEIWRDGGDPTEALDLAQEHGWQTIKPHWYWRLKNDAASQAHQLPNGQQNRPNPALERIARIAGVGEAQGNGGA